MIDRYEENYGYDDNDYRSERMNKSPSGEYVRYDDHIEIIEKLKCCWNCQSSHRNPGGLICDRFDTRKCLENRHKHWKLKE